VGAASSSARSDETTPQSTEPATAGEAAEPTIVKQDVDDDAKPPAMAEDAAVTIEPQEASSAIATTQDGTDTPVRAPVQRLGSLNDSRSASPAVRRGTSTRGKRGMVKPTFTGRRSKEERTALEKEALEREKADRKKRNEADKKAKRDAERATRGRGGYSGAMSGPFSLGSSREGR
jgi:DNA-directed RNA polymerase III subunit RPC4